MSQTLLKRRVLFRKIKVNIRAVYNYMIKNFYDYVKELVPEKGSVFFTHKNHSGRNDVSLYQIADCLCGQKIKFADFITAYSWNVPEIWDYPFDVIGLMFFREDEGMEKWIHFSKDAFLGAVCIVATKEGVTFNDDEHEKLRQAWERKLKNIETEDDKKYTDLEDERSNFDDEWWVYKPDESKRCRYPGYHEVVYALRAARGRGDKAEASKLVEKLKEIEIEIGKRKANDEHNNPPTTT